MDGQALDALVVFGKLFAIVLATPLAVVLAEKAVDWWEARHQVKRKGGR